MMRIIHFILDALFPPRSGERLVRRVDYLRPRPQTVLGVTALLPFSEPIVKAAITENKFHHNQTATKLLAKTLESWLEQSPKTTLLIPIPLSKQRQKARGYNQVEIILKNISLPHVKMDTSILKRTKDTQPQTSLGRLERLKNVRGVFTVSNPNRIDGKFTAVLLVDDVITTGSTFKAARAVLAPHLPPQVSLRCVALAH